MVSLVRGCELKDGIRQNEKTPEKVSLVRGCELKDHTHAAERLRSRVSLVRGCELKGPFHRVLGRIAYGQPRERL